MQEAKKGSLNLKFMEYGTYPEIKSALKAKRIDCFSVDGAILAGYVDDTTVILPGRFAPQDYGVAIKKSNTKLTKEVDKVIDKLKSTGEVDKLLKKWEIDK
jgi:putative glutamine transport system substrate-binding protein